MHQTLAQIMIAPGLAEPPRFPPAPLLDRFVLEGPYPLAGALLAAGVAIVMLGRARLATRTLIAASGVCLALALGAVLAGTLIVTDRERITDRTRSLVSAVAGVRPAEVQELLAEDAALYAFFTGPKGLSRPEIMEMVSRDMSGTYRLHDHTVREVRVLLEGPRVARAHVLVMVDPEETRLQTWSWWRIDWVREADAWRVRAIEPLSIQGIEHAGRR
jgi:hypothetical protein